MGTGEKAFALIPTLLKLMPAVGSPHPLHAYKKFHVAIFASTHTTYCMLAI